MGSVALRPIRHSHWPAVAKLPVTEAGKGPPQRWVLHRTHSALLRRSPVELMGMSND
jgi:hypothetical protein